MTSIDALIAALQVAKSQGATHVQYKWRAIVAVRKIDGPAGEPPIIKHVLTVK